MKNKKVIISAAAAVTALTMAGTTAFAAKKYTAQDLFDLGDHLVGKADVSGEDVNGDNVVDVFDLVEMRKSFDHTGVFKEQTFSATEENVKYNGRNYCDEKGVTWLPMSGSAIEFTVNARSAEIQILGDKGIENEKNCLPRYAVVVDGEVILDELLTEKEKTVKLFSGTEPRIAHVKVVHLTESTYGAVGVGSIKADTDVPVPVAPEQKKKISIEFIGDSITCAYGVEGKDQYENFKTSTENFMKSYAYLTAEKLDADYSAVSYSGYGIVSGYTSSGAKNTESLLPDYYDIIGKYYDYDKEWEHSEHKYDVIVVNLGTNDATYVNADFDNRSEEFTEGYTKFLSKLHEVHPDSYIICTLGTMGCTELYPCIETAVQNYKKEFVTNRIMCYKSYTHTMDDGMGSDWHPNENTQQNSAYVLADKICQILGLESDQLGVDMAADVKYSVKKGSGVNLSDYYSEWDNSYHITTVTGGKSEEDIQLKAGTMKLKKNGKYHLKFKLSADAGTEITFRLSDKLTGKVYHEDTLKGTGDYSSYEATVNISDDSECELVILAGGKDNSRVSLSSIKCVRTG